MSSYPASEFYARPLTLQEQPLVSVITPVYNGQEFLAECIESVVAQTYQNWDYTIVNNRSTDRTLEIAQSYAARDSRIRIHDNCEFLPIIRNHNHAIRQISPQSKYCKVVLADDWLFPECIMKMVALAEASPSVGLVGAYGLDGDGVHVIWRGLPFPKTVVPGREVCRLRLLQGRYVFGAPTATLIRSDLIRKVSSFYDESNLHADSTACFRILQESDFGFVHQLLTFTRSRGESNTSFAESMNSIPLSFLTELLEYGQKCLDEKEYRDRLKVRSREYYQVLAEGLLQLRGKNYLQFHERVLQNFGMRLSWLRLFQGFLFAAGNGLSHPILAADSLARWWSRARERKRKEHVDV
ncbi:MAG TPA: glycosyltransferase family 2 protein [Candidatus Acidoferrum sp.]|nr:glycosyltransferase family 2 protein [Candidatus Acidoferrum sp.]